MVHSVFSENKSSGSAGINGVWEDFWQQCRHYCYLTIDSFILNELLIFLAYYCYSAYDPATELQPTLFQNRNISTSSRTDSTIGRGAKLYESHSVGWEYLD